ncbi:hypothetical protein V5O48_012487 [Marasmius crinis-equi]|uniref:F-box domain-containing protein n=1 Tax=Marasmius crinis-equi TaxID=585013 RepID=A0ABR3F2P6_9AGAR
MLPPPEKLPMNPIFKDSFMPSTPSIHILPNEVLGRIFLFCLPLQGSKFNFFLSPRLQITRYVSPVRTILRVSSRWRRVAISTPKLWSILSINRPYPSSALRKLLPLHLERSRDVPLDIWWNYNHIGSFAHADTEEDGMKLIDVMRPHFRRIRRLEVIGFPGNMWQELGLDSDGDTVMNGSHFLNLCDLTITNCLPQLTPNTGTFEALIPIPWHALSTLTISCYADTVVPEVLRACSTGSKLRSLFLSLKEPTKISSFDWYKSVSPPVTLSNLEHLKIGIQCDQTGFTMTTKLLSRMCAGPSLWDLEFVRCVPWRAALEWLSQEKKEKFSGRLVNEMERFLERSGCKGAVMRLDLGEVPFVEGDVERLVEMLPALREKIRTNKTG